VGIIRPPAGTPGAGWALAATVRCAGRAGCQTDPLRGKPLLLASRGAYAALKSPNPCSNSLCIKKI